MLTPQIRAYLDAADRTILLQDMVLTLVHSFGLTAEQAGQAIVEHVNENTQERS